MYLKLRFLLLLQQNAEDVLSMVDREQGLTSEDADKIRDEIGPNELTADEPTSLWELLLEQFDDTLVQILLVSAAVSTGIAAFGTFVPEFQLEF